MRRVGRRCQEVRHQSSLLQTPLQICPFSTLARREEDKNPFVAQTLEIRDLSEQLDPGQSVMTGSLLTPRWALGLWWGSPWAETLAGPAEAISHQAHPSSPLSSPPSRPTPGRVQVQTRIPTSFHTQHSWVL